MKQAYVLASLLSMVACGGASRAPVRPVVVPVEVAPTDASTVASASPVTPVAPVAQPVSPTKGKLMAMLGEPAASAKAAAQADLSEYMTLAGASNAKVAEFIAKRVGKPTGLELQSTAHLACECAPFAFTKGGEDEDDAFALVKFGPQVPAMPAIINRLGVFRAVGEFAKAPQTRAQFAKQTKAPVTARMKADKAKLPVVTVTSWCFQLDLDADEADVAAYESELVALQGGKLFCPNPEAAYVGGASSK